jgi:enediyne biosynthesis protein E4
MIAARAEAGAARSRRRRRLLLLSLLAAGLIGGGWSWWTGRRYRGAMAAIDAEIVSARFAAASRDLVKLMAWAPDRDGRLAYLLGSCELARGRNKEANEAWARVIPGSAYSDRAILARMRLLADSGQFADAEQFIRDAAEDPRNERTALLIALVPIYEHQGRIDEARELIEARWEREYEMGQGASDSAIKLVRQHIDLNFRPTPVEAIRAVLDQAARQEPGDDRVWLGRANLAIRTGADDEARRWLDDCQRRRPEDVPVWRARLNWGLATGRVDVVRQAMTHLPAAESTPAHVPRLNAWLAAHRGDVAAGRRELESLSAIDPADRTALDRLAQLADKDSRPAESAALRSKKTAIDRLRARYEQLHERKQPARDAVELAHLAEQLGRQFEARAFLAVAIGEDPGREDLRQDFERLSRRPTTAAPRSQASRPRT